jgi:hypothetical protein
MPVVMLAGIERGSETAANRPASDYSGRRALLVERIHNACRREGKLNAPQFSIAQRCYL